MNILERVVQKGEPSLLSSSSTFTQLVCLSVSQFFFFFLKFGFISPLSPLFSFSIMHAALAYLKLSVA